MAAETTGPVAHHFNNMGQQQSTVRMGMWLFLVTEILFFGGAFCAYATYRIVYPKDFEDLHRGEGNLAKILARHDEFVARGEAANRAEIVTGRSSLRAQLNRARHKGVVVREWPSARVEQSAEIRGCLSEWLEDRPLPSLHFLIEPETLGDLADRRVFVAEQGEKVIAFLVASPIPAATGGSSNRSSGVAPR